MSVCDRPIFVADLSLHTSPPTPSIKEPWSLLGDVSVVFHRQSTTFLATSYHDPRTEDKAD